MGLEQLTLSLLSDNTIIAALSVQGVNIELLKPELELSIEENSEFQGKDDVLTETQPTHDFQRVLQRAVLHVQSSKGKEVTSPHVFNTILSEKQSDSAKILNKYGVLPINGEVIKPFPDFTPEAVGRSDINVQVRGKTFHGATGPMDTDIKARELINHIWMHLPEHSRDVSNLEKEALRLLNRAIKDLGEDLSLAKE